MDKKKIGIAVGCAAVAAVIAICAVTFGGKKGGYRRTCRHSRNRCCCRACRHTGSDRHPCADRSAHRNARTHGRAYGHTGADGCPHARCDRRAAARTAGTEQR